MRIYNDYLTTIRAAMSADPRNNPLNEYLNGEAKAFSKGLSYEAFNKQIPEKTLQPGLAMFAAELGLQPNFDQSLGGHPDFAYLKGSDQTENHYIVSMFIDIKGSTNFFRRYTLNTVLIIMNTIQRAAIHSCLIFGGYVHRLQGDGLFVYFGGKNMTASEGVQRSLQFSSVFSYFVKEDLKNLFNEQGIETIYTRIGIDLGYTEDVVWASAGLGEICEVTTCSLHTSLACKMQGHAQSNGIVVGDNVVKEVVHSEALFIPVCRRTRDEKDRYIFQIPDQKFNYTQYDFDWLSFLKKQSFVATDLYGGLQVKTRNTHPQLKVAANLAPIASISKPFFG